MKNVLLLKGGGSQEHDVSLVTASYISDLIDNERFKVFEVLVDKNFRWFLDEEEVQLDFQRQLINSKGKIADIDVCVPAFHGYPGETGHIQAYLEMIQLPFIGCGYEGSAICFNKALTKLWLEKAGVPVAEFIIANDSSKATLSKLEEFFDRHGSIFIKASNQGSSVGCYPVNDRTQIETKLKEAFTFSEFVVVERKLNPRELEISVYESQGDLIATRPCEILCPDKFYSYEEKYSKGSKTQTNLRPDIKEELVDEIRAYAKLAFKSLKLSQFCRMDFFLENDKVLLNEINTFPGMTPISMFPKMIEEGGKDYKELLNEHISALIS